jgi:hypothetical protein
MRLEDWHPRRLICVPPVRASIFEYFFGEQVPVEGNNRVGLPRMVKNLKRIETAWFPVA